jgi:hypothetical protein
MVRSMIFWTEGPPGVVGASGSLERRCGGRRP